MRIKLILVIGLLLSNFMFSQEAKKESENVTTKMDVFASKTGIITKYVDTKFPNLKTAYGSTENRIRKMSIGSTSSYFYQIIKEGKYSNNTASIEYSDLIEVLKALKELKLQVDNDVAQNPDYLENKFVTVDGFQVGYYVSGQKAKWYIKLEKYGSDNTLFVDNVDIIENAFNVAKNKIDELKK